MKNTLRISLKPNEKIYINGAVVKVDRKVAIEFLNDVQFLMENHVLQPEQATTPLRQLYFIVQVILMTPGSADEARAKAPAVVFIDELDSFPNRSALTHSQKDYVIEVVNSFIEQLDGIQGRQGLIFIGATNDVSRCDP